jgi:small subunit ribosomal protein S13
MLLAAIRATNSAKGNLNKMRVSGITLPNKRLPFALATLYGVGIPLGKTICREAKVDVMRKADELNAQEEAALRRVLESMKLEGDLKREVAGNIKRLKDIGAYRGSRHAKRLPARGQRTKTNSRTVRGNVRKTMGSGRRKVEKT